MAISVLRDYVAAQQRYASEPRDGSGVRRFASRFLSSPGKHDGLYWDAGPDEEPSPFGPLFDERAEAKRDVPYYGYRYRILTRQGAAAPGGAYSYVINGNLVAGFAAIAWPAEYGRTGVMTFIVNHYGTVYEKDLGPETAEARAGDHRVRPRRELARGGVRRAAAPQPPGRQEIEMRPIRIALALAFASAPAAAPAAAQGMFAVGSDAARPPFLRALRS